MKDIRLTEAAQWMHAKFAGEDKPITGVAIDSRALSENELFFALIGERSNGHDFIEEATRKRAAGVVVSQTVNSELPQLYVEDTCRALGNLARGYRKQFNLPMAAITGSYGKTTVKEMLARILAVEGPVLATQGNLNTGIGVPLTLVRLTPEHRFAVIEMGARKKGDIRYLMELANPTVALINNAGIAHIEIFGSENDVRNAKGELYAGLREDGIAVLNAEDPHLSYWQSLLRGQTVFTFGFGTTADLRISGVQSSNQDSHFKLHYQDQTLPIKLQALGEHNVRNSLAAAATALAMGASLHAVQEGLQLFTPVTGRLQFKKGNLNINININIIDDTYNANPVSMRAALAVLASQPDEKWFVMGDMLELGEHAETWHGDIGEEAKRLGVHRMFGIGKLTKNAIVAFGSNGKHYNDKSTLISELINQIQDLQKELHKNVTVLIKGSRGMRMEEVVAALQNVDGTQVSKENRVC